MLTHQNFQWDIGIHTSGLSFDQIFKQLSQYSIAVISLSENTTGKRMYSYTLGVKISSFQTNPRTLPGIL